MAVNCNISNITASILRAKRFGQEVETTDKKKFVYGYIQTLECNDGNFVCLSYLAPCDSLIQSECASLIAPSFTFELQAEGTNIDFIVDPNDITGTIPYTYQWDFNETLFELRQGNTTSSTIKLTRLDGNFPSYIYTTNVSVTITDSRGCSSTKICQFRLTRINGTNEGSIECNEENFTDCADIDMSISFINITNTGFTIEWDQIEGIPYHLVVAEVGGSEIINNVNVDNPYIVSGLNPNTEYLVKLTTECPNGDDFSNEENVTTTNIGSATLLCDTAFYSPINLIVGTPYVGTITISYTGGNGSAYGIFNVSSGGLTASLPAGNLNVGNGNLVLNVTGTPSSTSFSINLASLLGSGTCLVPFSASPTCTAPTGVTYQILNYNSISGMYTIQISWNAVAGAIGYKLFDGNSVISVPTNIYVLELPSNTDFEGTVLTVCGINGYESGTTPLEYTTPTPACNINSFVIGNILENSFQILSVNPSLTPGETIFYQVYDTEAIPNLIQQDTTSSLPVNVLGLDPDTEYTVYVQRICVIGSSTTISQSVTTLEEPDPDPTVYLRFEYSPLFGINTYDPDLCGPVDGYRQTFNTESVRITTFSDIAGTIPLDVTGMGVVLDYNHDLSSSVLICGGGETPIGSTSTNHLQPLSGTETYINCPTGNWYDYFFETQDCGAFCIEKRHEKSLIVINSSADYTII